MASAEQFDGYFLHIAQQTRGIEPLLETFFSFLRRKTDFFTGGGDGAAERAVLSVLRREQAIADRELAKKKEKQEAESREREKAERKRRAAAEKAAAARGPPSLPAPSLTVEELDDEGNPLGAASAASGNASAAAAAAAAEVPGEAATAAVTAAAAPGSETAAEGGDAKGEDGEEESKGQGTRMRWRSPPPAEKPPVPALPPSCSPSQQRGSHRHLRVDADAVGGDRERAGARGNAIS